MWSHPVPKVTAGWKVKGTETCGHAVMDLGSYFPDNRLKKNLKLPSACGLHVHGPGGCGAVVGPLGQAYTDTWLQGHNH